MCASMVAADDVASMDSSESAAGVNKRAVLCAFAILALASFVPFLAIANPPIVDFANHAARLTIACHAGDRAFADMYRYQFQIIPNLAIDLVNAPLCGVVSPPGVLKLVIVGSLSLIYISALLIQRKLFGRANAFLLLLPAISFNLVTTMGYINFLAGVAIASLLVALAIGRQRQFGTLLVLCNLGGLVIFFCHIFALGFAMLIFFGLMLRGERVSAGSVADAGLRTFALFIFPLALIAFVPHGHDTLTFSYWHKTRMLPALFMAQHATLGLYGLLLLAPLYLLLRNKVVRLDPRMKLTLLVTAVFILVIPCSIGNAVDIDSRLLVALAYLFFASLQPAEHEPELTIALSSFAIALVTFQLWAAATVWTAFSAEVDELRKSATSLPVEASVLTVAGDGPNMAADPLAYSHVSSYLTIERHIFNPLEFTGVGMQPLSVTPAFASIDTPTGQPYSPTIANRFIHPDPKLAKQARENGAAFALGWPDKFDYVIFYNFGRSRNFNPAVLSEVEQGSFFTIFKVKHPPGWRRT